MTTLFLLLLFVACNTPAVHCAEDEIRTAEKAFQQMTVDKGIAEAFYYFAADSAVIKRENDTLIQGKATIKNYYAQQPTGAVVTWSPDFTAASKSADMGYTYGRFRWVVKDNAGAAKTYEGVFHTVWQKDKNGQWKYVWD